MKKYLFYIIAALCSHDAVAQNVACYPFCEEGKEWTIDYDEHYTVGNHYQETYRLQGDTVIASHRCKKMYSKPDNSQSYSYYGAFYDDGQRVMYIPKQSTKECLVYDFSLKVGDLTSVFSFPHQNNLYMRVTSVSTCEYGGRSFRVLDLEEYGNYPHDNYRAHWVEGVGSGFSFLNNWSYQCLRCCTIGDEMFYFAEADHDTKAKFFGDVYSNATYVNVPFAEEGKHWAVRHPSTNAGGAKPIVEYAMHGDTIIGGLTAKRMFELDEDRVEKYVGAFFDRGHYTYFIAPGTTTPHLYYNFCSGCREMTRVWHNGAYAQLFACTCANGVQRFPDTSTRFAHPDIDDVDMFLQHTILGFVEFEDRDAAYNDTYGLKNNQVYQNPYHQEWWEGIGSTLGPMHNWEYPELDRPYGKELIACWTPDRILYDSEDYIGLCKVKEQEASCRIWREGSTWEYYDEEGNLVETYTLGAYAKNFDRYHYYMPLIKNMGSIEGFIRTERGDSLVYACGWSASGDLLPEVLLYDFTKSYESGDVMRLGAAKSMSGNLGVDELRIESSNDVPLTFFYNVFEEGDHVPQWNGVIYKIGCLEGPMAYYYGQTGKKKPSAKNLSHLIFGNKKRRGAPMKFFPYGNGNCVFAFDLFNSLCKASSSGVAEEDGNVVTSPLSAQFALSMLQNGAAGNTLKEMQFALGTSAYTMAEVNDYNHALIDRLQKPVVLSDTYREEWENVNAAGAGVGQSPVGIEELLPQMEIANGIWTAPWLPVYDAFFTANTTSYDAAAKTVDFGQQSTMDAIDQWVSDKTHGTISSINEAPDDDMAMMLINTLYFKGSWQDPFRGTEEKTFTNADGSHVMVPMMSKDEDMKHAETDLFKMVRIPYAPYSDTFDVGNAQVKYFMNIYLPKFGSAMLTAGEWLRLGADAVKGRTIMSMPRFTLDQDMQLNDVLDAMGLHDTFNSETANFAGISSVPTYVSKVKQLSHIDVDEKGTVASAATVVVNVNGTDHREPFEFRADHPFYFTIETTAGDILFIGRVNQIGNTDDSEGIVPTFDNCLSPALYDLSGRQLAPHAMGNGVYVVNGKKVIK